MSLRKFSLVIPNNDQRVVACKGNLIFVRSATAQVLVTAYQAENGQGRVLSALTPLSARQAIKTNPGETFGEFIVRNESGAQNTVEIVAGEGDYDAPLAAVTLTPPNTLASATDVTAGAAATSVSAADPTRMRIHLKALATNTVSVRIGDASIAANRGAELNPGEGMTLEGTFQVFAIREAAGNSDVSFTVEQTT